MFKKINVEEVVRAAGTFLFKYRCPSCLCDSLSGWPCEYCSECKHRYDEYYLDFEKSGKRNIIAVPYEKARKRISKKIVRDLYLSQGGYCGYCDVSLDNQEYHVDHIVPLAGGGSNERNNLVISCPKCNLKASSRYFKSYMDKRMYILNLIGS